jgi:hypothetical protein
MKFTDLILSERIRLINERHDVNLLYDLFEKHFPGSYEVMKSHLFLRGDFIKNRLFISSDSTEVICNVFTYLSRMGIKFESIGNFELRLNIHHFINKLL